METLQSKLDFQSVFKHPSCKKFNPYSQTVFANISTCHTAALGYQWLQCNNDVCGKSKLQYHCCGNRHCPYCGSMKREEWIDNRINELLPTAYYHVVFTLPHELNTLILGNRKLLFASLFDCASQTLIKHGRNSDFLGAEPGITMVLHTWGQDLSFHPHVHCIVTGGGFDGTHWIKAKRENNRFLFPSKSMASMYKAMFMEVIEKNTCLLWGDLDKQKILKNIRYKKWNVYAKSPFGGPAQVIEYLGRYTHKIAITKHRIVEVKDKLLKFKYKDYADGSKTKMMWLKHEEFLRRFEMHILPRGFVKIRHTGFLRSRDKLARIDAIRKSMGLRQSKPKVQIPVAIRMLEKYGNDINKCPCCQTGTFILKHDTRAERREKMKPITIAAPS